jgi:hypothetical protein
MATVSQVNVSSNRSGMLQARHTIALAMARIPIVVQ